MIHIAIHCLPHEIDQLENLLIQLKRNSQYLPDDHGMEVEVRLNMHFVKSDGWKIPPSFFISKFENLYRLTESWANVSHWGCRSGDGILEGCNDVRRTVINRTDKPYVMYLDVDNVFGNSFLYSMYLSVKHLHETKPEEYNVIAPQTTRMWDSSWDSITNEDWLSEEASHEKYDVRDPYVIFKDPSEKTIRQITGFKFAGWGTTISTNLARKITIPDGLGSYGLDDTFVMQGCYIMRAKGYDVKQYVIEDEMIIENNLFRFNPYRDYLDTIDKREEFLTQARANFPIEIQKLHERL